MPPDWPYDFYRFKRGACRVAENVVPLTLTDSAAADIVRGAAESGAVLIMNHAQERMLERGIDRAQVFDCLKRGRVKEPVHKDIGAGNWKLTLERIAAGQLVTVPVAIAYRKQGTYAAANTVYSLGEEHGPLHAMRSGQRMAG